MENAKKMHSVTLDASRCKGCINCIKRCPTEAIRVRNGKAYIIDDRCIDCGECIRLCPHHAKKPIFDPLSVMKNYKYTVALPAPALYGQFNNLDDINIVLNGLIKMGFDDVFEISRAAEIVSSVTKKTIAERDFDGPMLSSACPAVLRLIRIRFPELLEQVTPLVAPIDLAASMAAEETMEKTGLPREDIGIIFISPCAAKNTATKQPLRIKKSEVDAVVAIKEIYPPLVKAMDKLEKTGEELQELSQAGVIGIGWANSGGEAAGSLMENYLAADGIENVISVLEGLEDDKFRNLDFVELNACFGGCVGGVLTVENPYVAKSRIKKLRKYLPVSCNRVSEIPKAAMTDKEIEPSNVMSLSSNIKEAMEKLSALEELAKSLPGLDCGSCGAPSCRALAEDVIRGYSRESDCIFKYKEYLHGIMSEVSNLEGFMPSPFRRNNDNEEK